MFRELILTSLITTGAVTGLALTPSAASARPPANHERRHDRERFEVLVRHGRHWDRVGVFADRDDARRVARRLERQGHDTRVRRVEGRW